MQRPYEPGRPGLLNDESLILRAQQGDTEAFEQIVHRYDRRILALALRYTQDPDEAKDVYQEVFMRVYRALPRFQFRSQFTTWLHRIAVNVCHTHHERRQRRPMVSLDQPLDGPASEGPRIDLVSEAGSGEDGVLQEELSGQIRQALQQLSPKQRLVFVLRHYHDFKLREIAAMLRCAEGTVKRHLFTATQRMRQHLRTQLSEGI